MMKIWNKNTEPNFVSMNRFFFLKLIIRNIDIHTCLLDSTFLCPHLLYKYMQCVPNKRKSSTVNNKSQTKNKNGTMSVLNLLVLTVEMCL
jgi:hypothetical protein